MRSCSNHEFFAIWIALLCFSVANFAFAVDALKKVVVENCLSFRLVLIIYDLQLSGKFLRVLRNSYMKAFIELIFIVHV